MAYRMSVRQPPPMPVCLLRKLTCIIRVLTPARAWAPATWPNKIKSSPRDLRRLRAHPLHTNPAGTITQLMGRYMNTSIAVLGITSLPAALHLDPLATRWLSSRQFAFPCERCVRRGSRLDARAPLASATCPRTRRWCARSGRQRPSMW
eukprot:scaffold20267_cov114-Isochrysis_galbana.AAC.8